MSEARVIWQGQAESGEQIEISYEPGNLYYISVDGDEPICIMPAAVEARLIRAGRGRKLPLAAAAAAELSQLMQQLWERPAPRPSAAPAARVEEGLRLQRNMLAARIDGLRDQLASRRDQAWERGDAESAFARDEARESQLAAAEQALRDFDAAHPELLAALEAERRAASERAMWR